MKMEKEKRKNGSEFYLFVILTQSRGKEKNLSKGTKVTYNSPHIYGGGRGGRFWCYQHINQHSTALYENPPPAPPINVGGNMGETHNVGGVIFTPTRRIINKNTLSIASSLATKDFPFPILKYKKKYKIQNCQLLIVNRKLNGHSGPDCFVPRNDDEGEESFNFPFSIFHCQFKLELE